MNFWWEYCKSYFESSQKIILRYMILICLITTDIHFDHLVKRFLSGLCNISLLFFPFVIAKYIVDRYFKIWKYSISHHFNTPILASTDICLPGNVSRTRCTWTYRWCSSIHLLFRPMCPLFISVYNKPCIYTGNRSWSRHDLTSFKNWALVKHCSNNTPVNTWEGTVTQTFGGVSGWEG